MTFVNEKIPEKDKAKIAPEINFEKIRAIAKWIPEFREPIWWTVDRESGAYLIFLTGGGREQNPYYLLGLDNQVIVFNVEEKGTGNSKTGLKKTWTVHNLQIPSALELSLETVKKFIREGLAEYIYFQPLADGGTVDKPNTKTRKNIHSFTVNFE
jgi:hypothetical protein